MTESIIKVSHVSKRYRLGQIGGTTLREELQRLGARMRGNEDPTRRIGTRVPSHNETFMALEDVSFEVARGERIGIVGRNGAGKSTLLKLISRVTAPTEGWIGLNGRVASMLEVGTGFHCELTGRENIYLNGAILGMTMREISSRIDEIVEFSECAKFIDTPVKRYSSGMYVKLAFSVAAHLDSEIMIMDEVLAVGDMAFQKKCIDKMNSVSIAEGRTILYVSHNMSTIRQLCDKCALLDHGKLVYLGDVEEAIRQYADAGSAQFSPVVDLRTARRLNDGSKNLIFLEAIIDRDNNTYAHEEPISLHFVLDAVRDLDNIWFQFILFSGSGLRVAKSDSADFSVRQGINKVPVKVPLEGLADGSYYFEISLFETRQDGSKERCDCIQNVIPFKVKNQWSPLQRTNPWRSDWFGHIMLKPVQVLSVSSDS